MFTQSCFIRKNTSELRNKLEEFGYTTSTICKDSNIATSSILGKYSIISDWQLNSTNPHITWNNGHRIDCGTNEELFLAIAALRDDNDYMQWFTDGEKWLQNKQNDIEVICYCEDNLINFHKATVEELIEHFK